MSNPQESRDIFAGAIQAQRRLAKQHASAHEDALARIARGESVDPDVLNRLEKDAQRARKVLGTCLECGKSVYADEAHGLTPTEALIHSGEEH